SMGQRALMKSLIFKNGAFFYFTTVVLIALCFHAWPIFAQENKKDVTTYIHGDDVNYTDEMRHTEAHLGALFNALRSFKSICGRYPTTKESLLVLESKPLGRVSFC